MAAVPEARGKIVRLLLVDDSDVYRSTMELLLGREPGLEVVATAADSDAALRACRELDVDLVLLDYRLPDADGTVVTSVLVDEHPDVSVVCLTAEASSGRARPRSSSRCRRRRRERRSGGAPWHDSRRRSRVVIESALRVSGRKGSVSRFLRASDSRERIRRCRPDRVASRWS